MYWQDNFDTVMSLTKEAKSHRAPAWLLTVQGTIHVSQSDFSIIYPHICTALMKMTVDPKRALDLNTGATLEFLKLIMKNRSAIVKRTMQDEGILQVRAVEDVPDAHKPENKWTAVRLKIPHEFRQRILPRLERKIKRQSSHSVPSDEVWMHISTSESEIEAWEGGKGFEDSTDEDTSTTFKDALQSPIEQHPALRKQLCIYRDYSLIDFALPFHHYSI